MDKKPSDSAIKDSEFWHFYALDAEGACPDLRSREVKEWQFDGVNSDHCECGKIAEAQKHSLTHLQEELAKWLPAT